jgi:hypothetical protein
MCGTADEKKAVKLRVVSVGTNISSGDEDVGDSLQSEDE